MPLSIGPCILLSIHGLLLITLKALELMEADWFLPPQ